MAEPEPEDNPDPSESTLEALRELTGLDEGEELLGDPELRERYRKLKKQCLDSERESQQS